MAYWPDCLAKARSSRLSERLCLKKKKKGRKQPRKTSDANILPPQTYVDMHPHPCAHTIIESNEALLPNLVYWPPAATITNFLEPDLRTIQTHYLTVLQVRSLKRVSLG